ncbi:MAG: SemiSWEET transporter [archaeon]
MIINAIGFCAAALTTFAGLPQIVKILRKRHTKDISLEMYIMLCLGTLLWLLYGILRKDIVLITANTVSIAITGTILGFKLKYR